MRGVLPTTRGSSAGRGGSPERRDELLAAVLVALAVGVLQLAGVLHRADRAAEDLLLAAAARLAPSGPASDVVVVAVDPHSLRALPDWPWSRSVYAEVLEQLDRAGATAVAFDVDFSTPRDAEGDAAFAAALERSGRGVLAAFQQSQSLPGIGELEVASVPPPALREGAAALGSVLVPVDSDGVVRRAPRASPIGADTLPSLAGAALGVVTGAPPPAASGSFPLDFRREHPRPTVLSLVDVVEGRFDPRDVAGRAAFVGATAVELQDLWATPLGPAQPGVFIQVAGYRTLQAERAGEPVLRHASQGERLAGVLLLAAVLAPWVAPRRRHGTRVAGLLLAAVAVSGASWLAIRGIGLLWSPLSLWGVIAGHYALGLESVRSRIHRRLDAHETSLVALEHVSSATTVGDDGGRSGLGQALQLLAAGVDASRVALLRGDLSGLDGQRLEWRPDGAAVCLEEERAEAERVLRERAARVFEGRMPGWPTPGGSAIYSPLYAGEAAVGVLVVECAGRDVLDTTQRRTVATVSAQLALSAHNLRLVEHLQRTFDSSIAALATAVEARDGYTDLHCRRLAAFSAVMAERLGLPPEEVHAIELGALLHDVGKIGICDAILNKPGRFTPEERAEMQRHPDIGAGIVGPVHGLSDTTLACVRHHHERWDGGGYPCGLAGEEIPLAARIVTVVDVWDALSSARPYKAAYSQERVLALLRKGRGVEFDPDVVDLFLEVLDEQGEEMLELIESHSSGGGAR